MSSDSLNKIESVLNEQRIFNPSDEDLKKSRISGFENYQKMVDQSKTDPLKFWSDAAIEELHWFEPFHTVLDWTNPPFARWFEGGKTNLSFNCLDRHLLGENAEKCALIWEGEPGDVRSFTYRELHAEVCKTANALKSLGIKKGELVALYMPKSVNTVVSKRDARHCS